MKTMYRVEERIITNLRSNSWEYRQKGEYVNTIEEATEYAKTNVVKKNNYDTGDYKIIERTIDEKTFTVVENIVIQYEWWKEVKRYEIAEKNIVECSQRIAEIEASKVNCNTDASITEKDKKIAQYKEWVACAEAVIAERR